MLQILEGIFIPVKLSKQFYNIGWRRSSYQKLNQISFVAIQFLFGYEKRQDMTHDITLLQEFFASNVTCPVILALNESLQECNHADINPYFYIAYFVMV